MATRPTSVSTKCCALPHLVLRDGTIEALKWLALILMTGDHANKYLFNGTLPLLFEVGRLALPLFVFVLAYNLARPGTLERGAYPRTIKRLIIFGALATPPYIALGGLISGWWPLNAMFLLLVMTATLYMLERQFSGHIAIAVTFFLIGGSSVEYWWPAIVFGLAIWSYCKQPSLTALIVATLACAALKIINHNPWALLALPLILIASHINFQLPRLRWAFYLFYPLHLALLWLIRIPMSQAGYLFFY